MSKSPIGTVQVSAHVQACAKELQTELGTMAAAAKLGHPRETFHRIVDGGFVRPSTAAALEARFRDVSPKDALSEDKSLKSIDPETRATLEKMSEQLSKLERCYAELAEYLRATRPAQAA